LFPIHLCQVTNLTYL